MSFTPDVHRPADMPIWARLILIARQVPFAAVTGWTRFDDGHVVAYCGDHGARYLARDGLPPAGPALRMTPVDLPADRVADLFRLVGAL